jgi:hypothetical protein
LAREIRHMSDVGRCSGACSFQVVRRRDLALGAALAFRPTRRRSCPAPSASVPCSRRARRRRRHRSLVYWPAFSTPFHLAFFGESSWRFDDTDTLRRLYPDRFWIDTAVVLGAFAVAQAGALWFLACAWERRAQGRRVLAAKPAA